MRLHLTAKRGQGQGVQVFRLLSRCPVPEKVRKEEKMESGEEGSEGRMQDVQVFGRKFSISAISTHS